MFAGMRSRKKTRFSCMGAQFKSFCAMLHAAFGMCDVPKTFQIPWKNCLGSSNGRVCILSLSWSWQGQIGGFLSKFTFCWAYIGPLGAYVRPYKKYSVSWMPICWPYLSPLSWPKCPYWVISRLCWAYLGSCAGVFGHLDNYVEILAG